MALTKGQAYALHTMLMSRSQMRLHLEGKYTVTPNPGGGPPVYTYAENLPPVHKAADRDTMVANVIAQAGTVNIPAGAFDQTLKAKLRFLFDPNGTDLNGAQTNLALHPHTVLHALGMDSEYPDNTPCPPFTEQQAMAAAIIASLPGAML